MDFSWKSQEDNEEKNHNYYNTLLPLWENIFPTSPFNICLPRHFLDYLDEPFTIEAIIIIEDTRINNSYTIVKAVYNKPITLRRILNRMIVNKLFIKNTYHYLDYLDGFEIINNNYYKTIFGSEEI
jgi:hypothetical protein